MSITQHLINLCFRVCKLPIIKWRSVELMGHDLCLRVLGHRNLTQAEICRASGTSTYQVYYSNNGCWEHTETKTLAGAQLFVAKRFKKYNA